MDEQLPFDMLQEDLEHLESMLRQTVSGHDPQRLELISKLPALTEEDLRKSNQHDSSCPICLTPFLALLAAEEMALAMDSPAHASQELGVTRLVETCGHHFCRKDISTWIRDAHDSCPTCRRLFLQRQTTTTSSALGADEDAADHRDGNNVHIFGSAAEMVQMLAGRPIGVVPGQGTTMSGGTLNLWGPGTESALDEDRHDYAAMYS